MNPLATERIPTSHLRSYMTKQGAQFFPKRSNSVRHIYFARRLNRWLAVSNEGAGWLRVNHYSECPCGATR